MGRLNSVLIIVSVLFAIFVFRVTHAVEQEEIARELKQGLEDYLYGNRIRSLNMVFELLQFPRLFRTVSNTPDNGAVCLACNTIIPVILTAVRSGVSTDTIKDLIIILCTEMKIESPTVCREVVNLHIGILFFIVRENRDLTGLRFCSIVFQDFGCVDPFRKDWHVYIPPKTKVVNKSPHQNESIKVLQITDLHYSLEYTIGSNAVCGDPLCCQYDTPSKPEDAAKRWGDYRDCDMPWEALVTTMDHIITTHKNIEYVYYLGDTVDHKVWDTSVARNTRAIVDVTNLLKNVFSSTPVFPVIGNHETHPVNVFGPNISNLPTTTQWVYDLLQAEWSTWLPDYTKGTLLKGGYYTVLVRPGFRIIVLNSNVCYIYNWWLLYNDVDPYDQLKWLVLVLASAEINNEIVHILSHIPSGDPTCLKNWAREYSKIVARFSNTIAAQFNGHTHTIEKIIYYDTEDIYKPINIALNGGSLSPFSNVNPNYIIYSISTSSFEVIDYDLWIYDVAEANLQEEMLPRWFKLYTFREAYNISGLSPYDMDILARRIAKSCVLQNQYFRYKYKNAYPSVSNGCDKGCTEQNLCNMVTSYFGDIHHCQLIKQQVKTCPNNIG